MDQIVDQSDVLLLQRLLATMGKGDVVDPERGALIAALRVKKAFFQRQIQSITTEHGFDTKRELLQKLLVRHAEMRELREQLGARKRDIAWAAINGLSIDELGKATQSYLTSPEAERMAEVEAKGIQRLLDTEAAESKKSPLRRLLIEPFLFILHHHGVVPSQRKLPLNRMIDALYDFVGFEGRRLTDAGIRTIAADMRRELENVPVYWR